MDSGLEEITGIKAKAVPLAGVFSGSKNDPIKIYLGEARTDEEGRLVVLAGHGKSMSIEKEGDHYPYLMTDFDSSDWIDDTSDGLISVTIKRDSAGIKYVCLLCEADNSSNMLLALRYQGKLEYLGRHPSFLTVSMHPLLSTI